MAKHHYPVISLDAGLCITFTPLRWRLYVEGPRNNPGAFFRLAVGPLYIAVER